MGKVRPPESFHVLSLEGEMYGESHWSQWGGPLPTSLGAGPLEPGKEPSLGRCREVTPMSRKGCITAFVFWESKRPRGKVKLCFGSVGQWLAYGGTGGRKTQKNCTLGAPLVELSAEEVLSCFAWKSHAVPGNGLDQQWRSVSRGQAIWDQFSKVTPCGSKKQQQQQRTQVSFFGLSPLLPPTVLSSDQSVWNAGKGRVVLDNYRE